MKKLKFWEILWHNHSHSANSDKVRFRTRTSAYRTWGYICLHNCFPPKQERKLNGPLALGLKKKRGHLLPFFLLHCTVCGHLVTQGFPRRLSGKKKKKKIHLPMQETQEAWVRFLGQKDPLREEMATHSCILAWKIPWTEGPGRLQSMGLQRVGHDWATELNCYVCFCADLFLFF